MDNEAAPGAGTHFAYRNRDPWLNLSAPKLVHLDNGLNVYADIRAYIPATSSKVSNGAVRLTQNTSYDVPTTRLSLGLYTFERGNMLTDVGAAGNMENFDLDVSPYASYQLTPSLAITLWTDVVQATYSVVGSDDLAQGWSNATPIDAQLGIGWDITPKVNLNPYVSFFPGMMSADSTIVGAILSAKFL